MSANTAELTLILKAKNLADVEIDKIRAGLGKIADKASSVASDMITAFKGIGRRIATQMGNIAEDIFRGGNIADNLLGLGALMAGAAVEGMMAHFIPNLLGKIAATATFAPLAAALTAQGATLGGVLAAAIPVGMAALPFLILAAAVAALVYLITNPEARQKAKDAGIMILKAIGAGLQAAFGAVLGIVKGIVGAIISVINGIIGAVKEALHWIGILEGKKVNKIEGLASKTGVPGHAAGGWVGLRGPELAMVGEKGPEYVIPNHQLGGGGTGVRIQGISEREILDMVDRGFYFKLSRSAPTRNRA